MTNALIINSNASTQNNVSPVVNNAIDVSEVNLPHAIVTEVLLKNGKTAQVITLFNQNDLSCEEVQVGVIDSLKRLETTKAYKSTFCSGVKQGILKPVWSTSWNTIQHYRYDNKFQS